MEFKKVKKVYLFGILISLLSCSKKEDSTSVSALVPGSLTLSSTAFTNNGRLPILYTCDGSSFSPPIAWKDAPVNTVGYAVTMHHIPAPGEKHVYLVLYNIANTVSELVSNTSGVGVFGINTVNGKQSYSPPCSQGPGDKLYTITVYALSAVPKFTVPASTISMDVLLDAIKTTTLATGTMNVVYAR